MCFCEVCGWRGVGVSECVFVVIVVNYGLVVLFFINFVVIVVVFFEVWIVVVDNWLIVEEC